MKYIKPIAFVLALFIFISFFAAYATSFKLFKIIKNNAYTSWDIYCTEFINNKFITVGECYLGRLLKASLIEAFLNADYNNEQKCICL